MRFSLRLLVLLLLLGATVASAAEMPAATEPTPVTVEYYYRIKWGSAEEFKRLYAKNHAPLLDEMKKLGFVRSVRADEPFTHMAGGPRWDLRITISFRDAAAAISDPDWDKRWEEAKARLYADRKAFDAEEQARFALLEEHWDVVVNEVHPK